MARAHCYRPVLDQQGNVLSDLVVRIYEPGTTSLISEPVYLGALEPTGADQPIPFTDGVIDFYLDDPKRVRIGVRKGVDPEQFFEDVDVLVTAAAGAGLTKAEADALYMAIPAPIAGPDPETGAPTTLIPKFTLQTIVNGVIPVTNHLVKPGLRVPQPGRLFAGVVHAETPPQGTEFILWVDRWNSGAYVDLAFSVTVEPGASIGVNSIADEADWADFAKGDVIKFECWSVGSTTPIADINISLDFM